MLSRCQRLNLWDKSEKELIDILDYLTRKFTNFLYFLFISSLFFWHLQQTLWKLYSVLAEQTHRMVSVFAWGRIFKGAAPPEGMAATQAGDPEEVPPKPLPPHTLLKAFFPAPMLGSAKKRNPFSTTRLVEALSTCSSLFLSITEPQCYLQHKWPV